MSSWSSWTTFWACLRFCTLSIIVKFWIIFILYFKCWSATSSKNGKLLLILISMWVRLMLSWMIIFFCAKCITFRTSLIASMNFCITNMWTLMHNLFICNLELTLFFYYILFVYYIWKRSNTILPLFQLFCIISDLTDSILLARFITLVL